MPRPRTPDFETDKEFEFEFYLAEQMSMPVGRLRDSMTNQEFMQWSVYYGRRAQAQELEAKRVRS